MIPDRRWLSLARSMVMLSAMSGFAAAATAASAAAQFDASEVGLRDDLAWLTDRGLINLGLGTWPLPAGLVEAAIAARRAGDWSAADLDALARIRSTLLRLDEQAALAWRSNTARHPVSDAGSAVRARNEASAQLQLADDNTAVRLRLGAQEQRLARAPSPATLDGSYVAIALPSAVLSLAAVDRWWGPARYASPVLGNAAPPIPTVTLRRSHEEAPDAPLLAWIGPWSYELSVGRPSHYRPRGPLTLGMRLSARPLPGFELAISRYIYWAGEGRPHSLRSLGNALLGRSNIDDPALDGPDPSNEIAGFDLRWAHSFASATWVGYAHLAGEDEANGIPSNWIATLGLQLKHATPAHRIEWTAEGSETRPGHLFGLRADNRQAAYQHGIYVDGHYHQGLPVGATIGGGGMLGGLGVVIVPIDSPAALRYEARLWSARVSQHGPEPINAAFGRPGRIDGASLQGSGVMGRLRWRLGLALQQRSGDAEPGRRSVGLIGGLELPLLLP